MARNTSGDSGISALRWTRFRKFFIQLAIIAWLCSFLGLAGCASKNNLVVLLPDPDGQVGVVEVTSKGGSQLLTEAGHATEIKAADAVPTIPIHMKETEVLKIFDEAISAQPPPPIMFLLYFQSGTTELTVESQQKILDVLAAIESRRSKDITIVGHTDRVGAREANYRLGLERAESIKEVLVSKGADPAGIEVTSHGEDNPLIKTADEVEEPRNRRIEITVR